jgi:patatin-like phospholipase/acyl hydrolase
MASSNTQANPRSSHSSATRRQAIPWPSGQPFRILALDGGGIKGIFSASILATLEAQLPQGGHLNRYFDLIAGTSTGGILAMGLGAEIPTRNLLELYLTKGAKLFPPGNATTRLIRSIRRYFQVSFDATVLEGLLQETFAELKIRDSKSRLCIPASEGRHGEIFVVKTPHHPDYHLDGDMPMVKVGLATGAAPTFLKAVDEWGYRFVDGGIWANCPILVAVVEAMTAFDVTREQIQVLSIGCGGEPFVVTNSMATGGILRWRKVIDAAMNLQTQSALSQARLLLGPDNVIRLEPRVTPAIDLDDWARSSRELPGEAESVLAGALVKVRTRFLQSPAHPATFFSR